MKLHASGEDYLKAIFILQKEKGMVRSVDVAERGGVSKPNVSRAVNHLREGGFLMMNDDYTLHLTDQGREIAKKMVERHKYFVGQLTNVGVDTSTAEVEACKMEHTLSDDSFRKLQDQKPKECPFSDICNFKPDEERGT